MCSSPDPYLDPETGVLRNKLAVTSPWALLRIETDLVWARTIELGENQLLGSADLDEFRSIHFHLFQDLYNWAGEIRLIDIRKKGQHDDFFLPHRMIERAAHYASEEVELDQRLEFMDRETFITRLSYHYEQWNHIHPFRDGNGRTQRIVWSRLARSAGRKLHWSGASQAQNDEACRIASRDRDFGPLVRMFGEVVDLSRS